MSISIPEGSADSVATLFQLSESDRDRLLSSLAEVEPEFRHSHLLLSVVEHSGLELTSVQSVLTVLVNLSLLCDRRHKDLKTFVNEDVAAGFAALGDDRIRLDGTEWEGTRDFLLKALALESISISAKASDVAYSNERLFTGARILTDVRPVFSNDLSPTAAVLIHSLKIDYVQDGETHERFFSLDSSDLTTLRDALDRALRKGRSLEETMISCRIKQVGPKVE